ncbi:MAG: TolA protein, partial [Myxococcaceae bacterium]|nr:TolA protein [Myxococcaceae bacterium]
MSDEPRKEQKVKAKALKVKYKSATLEDFIEQYAKDISRTGMWIKTPKPPALGELLKIEIQLKDETPVLKAAGRVVQRREEAEARPDAPPGMGVKFLKVDEGLEVLERIMARKGEGAGPHFESLRPSAPSVAPPAPIDSRSGDFFGHGPAAPLPAEQDQTVMRQMNALLGEALRQAKSPSSSPEGDAAKAPVGSMKSTMVGMGLAEAAEAVKSARSALAQAEATKTTLVHGSMSPPPPSEAVKPAAPPEPPRSSAQLRVNASSPPEATGSARATLEFTTGELDALKAPSAPPGTVPMKAADVAAVSDDSTQRASRVEIDAALRAMRELPDEPRPTPAAEAKAVPAATQPDEAAVGAGTPTPAEESAKADAAKSEPPVAADALKSEPAAAEAAKAEPAEVEPAEAEPAKVEPPKVDVAAAAPTPLDDDARITDVVAKKPEPTSIERLIEESVVESPPSVRPPSVRPAPARPVAVAEVDAPAKKRSPMVLYAAIGVVLVVGAVAMLMRGDDPPGEPTPAPIAEPAPGPAATTPPIPPREPTTPPVMEQPPVVPPVPTVQPPPPN